MSATFGRARERSRDTSDRHSAYRPTAHARDISSESHGFSELSSIAAQLKSQKDVLRDGVSNLISMNKSNGIIDKDLMLDMEILYKKLSMHVSDLIDEMTRINDTDVENS